jgi:enediyne biosynthesis protein E8
MSTPPGRKEDLVPESRTDDRTLTLEAFADTILPGEKRFPGDRSVAGAAAGPGAVAAGAIELLETPATGVTDALDYLAQLLGEKATAWAQEHDVPLDEDVPAFVALPFEQRTELLRTLLSRDNPERDGWVLLTMFSNMAYDSAAHRPTAEAIADGHPGLLAMGMTPPDADGLWRYSRYSYGRPLAELHPDTLPNGSLG